MTRWWLALARDLGPLRAIMAVLVLGLVALGPVAGGPVSLEGAALFTSVVAPALYVIFVFVLPLDVIMSLVFGSAKPPAERGRYRRIVRVELALLVVLLASWAPFVARLLRITD